MKKSLILFLAGMLMGTYLVPMSVFAQNNIICTNSTPFLVSSNFVFTQGVYNLGANSISLPLNSPCNQNNIYKNERWYSTIKSPNGIILKIKFSNSPGLLEIYSGRCNNLAFESCTPILNRHSYDSLTLLIRQTTYDTLFVRILGTGPAGFNPNGSPMWIAAKPLSAPRQIISKRRAGHWDSASSWVSNTVPTYNDSVIIDDGSTITANYAHIYNPASLTVGQQDTNLRAKLIITPNNTTAPFVLNISGPLTVNRHDTIAVTDNNIEFQIKNSLRLDGGMWGGFYRPMLKFNGKGNQVFEGTGNLDGLWDVKVQKARHDTLFQTIPLNLPRLLSLDSGLVVSLAPMRFYVSTSDHGNGNFSNQLLQLGNGAIKNPNIQVLSPNYQLYDWHSYPLIPNDSVRNLNRYIVPGANLIFQHNRLKSTFSGNRTFHYNGGYTDSAYFRITNGYHSYYTYGLLTSGPTDTLFFGQGNANLYPINKADGYDVGAMVFNPALVPQITDTVFFPFYKYGHKRQVVVNKGKKFKNANQTLSVSVKPVSPGGQLIRPLAYMQGNFVFEINSNRDTLPTDAYLKFMYLAADSFTGSLNNLRMAQAQTPNGPWHNISPSSANIQGNHLITNTGIDLRKGHYFAFGSVDPGRDLSFDWIRTTAPALIGPGFPGHDLKIQIKNESSVPALEAKISWKVNSPTPVTGTSYIVLSPPLSANADTVIGLNPTDFIKVPYTGLFQYTITLDSNISNAYLSSYDTIKLFMDNRPHTLPYTQNYDTIRDWALPLQYRSTPPNLSDWKLMTNQKCFLASSGKIRAYTTKFSQTELITEPVLLTAGTLYYSMDAYGNYSTSNGASYNDSVLVSISLDSGKTYSLLFALDSNQFAYHHSSVPTHSGQINVQQQVVAHLKVKSAIKHGANEIDLTIDNLKFSTTPLTVQQYINSGPIQIYPNPSANGSFRLRGVNEAVPVQVISLTGQILYNQILNPEQEISLPELSAGVYLVKVSTRDGNKVVRWVVER